MSRILWPIFYIVGFAGLALMCWRGLCSIADTVEFWTRRKDR